MMSRCNNPHDKDYPGIGGKGIKVCEKWQAYEGFLADIGEKPEGTLLRRVDESANFEPTNAYWMVLAAAVTNPLYGIWKGIRRRCGIIGKKTNKATTHYVGRGIQMHAEWQDDFHAFAQYLGARPSQLHTVERVDNNKGYFPGNIEWALQEQQSNNRHDNVFIEMNGERRTLSQWVALLGLDGNVVRGRWHNLFAPSKTRNRPVSQRTMTGEFVALYKNAKEAATATGIKRGTISKCLSGGNASSGGYLWIYA